MSSSTDMRDAMVALIRETPEGVSSRQIAEQILKFKNPEPQLAHVAVQSILRNERRCRLGEDGRWYAAAGDMAGARLGGESWRVVYVLTDEHTAERTVLHVSVWSVAPSPALQCSVWLIDPASLPAEEQAQLRSPADDEFKPSQGAAEAAARIAAAIGEGVTLFLSAAQSGLLLKLLMEGGEEPPLDDTLLLSHLTAAAGVKLGRPITLFEAYRAILERDAQPTAALRFGECLAECVGALIDRLALQGISSRDELEEYELEAAAPLDWAAKAFSLQSLREQPTLPGVYGFKDRQGGYLYIGKAKNLRRRLLSYFRFSDESPRKLTRLREESHSLEIHRCGSELESLIYEHRLIKRHAPLLNRQSGINERKGQYAPLQDCILLLPHAEQGKGLAVLYRRNQKIRLRPFWVDFRERQALCAELEAFFFKEDLPAAETDFPEQEIVFRWARRHRDSLVVVMVNRSSGPAQLCDAMQSAWKELASGSGQPL